MSLDRRRMVQTDLVWAVCTAIGASIFPYLQTYLDTNLSLANKAMLGLSLMVTGVSLGFVIVGFRFDGFLSAKEILMSMGWVLGCLACIVAVNKVASIPLAGASAGGALISARLFRMLMAVGEENFFSGFIQPFFASVTGNDLLAILFRAGMATVYHLAVYGMSFSLLIIVFGAFAALGAFYWLSGYRVSVPMLAHVAVNFLAS